jgi:regulatory protein
MIMKSIRKMTPEEALSRLQNLCSASEKCTGELREKLRKWEIPEGESEKIVEKLKKDKFVDDNRFAGFFVRDKQKINKWGKEKIRYALIHKGLNKEIIDEALSTLPNENFEDTLRELLSRKSRQLEKYERYEKRNRLIRFAIQRGFDYDLIFRVVDDFVRD